MKEITFKVKISGYDLDEIDINDILGHGFDFHDDIQWRRISSTVISSKEVEDIDPPEEDY